MATRKPTARSRSTMGPPPAGPPPAASKSRLPSGRAPSRSQLTFPVEDMTEASGSMTASQASSKRSAHSLNDSVESSIQVYIRCRRRSEREIQEGSPIIISTEGPRGQNVTIETAATTSILGVVTLPPTRTYPFDTTFGPEADQSMVYQDVVHPMLDEVIKGYNCTLFAYGQTGTGKTYTMQGDLSLTPLGNPSAQAGMIPRALFKLFHQLESMGCDYSVKISYVELYNEELRDLLAPETSPSNQVGSKDAPPTLKIFDDSSKRGVFIQGIEEVPVKDFRDSLSLLEKGSQKRQIAATKFNDHSSRSHSVFCITVHSKEISSLGDDLLRVGKLNLVDLAGSENIGRSGAENKRAREAGMINQSLLTLGRVINALVDKSSHVPYRESKLTRLLQDSLGGRTKTCIIATISPARSNMEETLSTLDYAMRAKSIRNKPEVNQRMSRNALLKEYIGEIERLKSDVLAAREKNGIYFSEDTWAQLNADHELRQTQVEEAKKQVEAIESQMRVVREEFEQSIALFMKTDGELKTTKQKLETREDELMKKESELKVVQVAYEEESVMRRAHAETEDILDDIATGLKQIVEESTADCSGLFEKIDRYSQEFKNSSRAVKEQSSQLDTESKKLTSRLQGFLKASEQSVVKMKALTENFQKQESSAILRHRESLEEQLTKIMSSLQTMKGKEEASEKNLNSIWAIVKEVQDRLANELSQWSESVQAELEKLCSEIESSSSEQFTTTESAMTALGSIVEKLIKDARSTLDNDRKASERQHAMVSQTAAQEIKRLKYQNAHLTELLDAERKNATLARDNLVKNISSLLVTFAEERDKSLREVVSVAQLSNGAAESGLEAFGRSYAASVSDGAARSKTWASSLDKAAVEGSQSKLTATESLHYASTSIRDGLSSLRSSTSTAIKEHSDGIIDVSKTLNSCSKVFEREQKIKRARLEASTHLADEATSSLQQSQAVMEASSKSLQAFGKHMSSESSDLKGKTQNEISTALSQISAIEQCNKAMVGRTSKEMQPTGATPQKRKWSYIDKWEKTRSRVEVLQEHREKKVVGSSLEQSLSSTDTVEEEEQEFAKERLGEQRPSDEVTEHDHDMSDLQPCPAAHVQSLLSTIDMDSEIPQYSESSDSPESDELPSLPPVEVELPAAQARTKRRESSIPMKMQPIRPKLQEKSTNIVSDARTRPVRNLRVRR